MDSHVVRLEEVHVEGLQKNKRKMPEGYSSISEITGLAVSLRRTVSHGAIEGVVRRSVQKRG